MPAENRDVRDNEIKPATIHDGGPVVDGDGIQRRIWVIAAGASDPADAEPDDLIFEEQ